MNRILIGLAMICIGVVHIVAAHKEWGWYVNNYQVKPILRSKGRTGMRWYTYLMCSPCIIFGIYLLLTEGSLGS